MQVEAPDVESVYDCVIIGGGPAGLTCAIFLGRYRLRVLVVDSGKPRNYASHGVHGFLGQHGIKPHELLKRGRQEASDVGVEFCDCVASKIEKNGELFEITTTAGMPRARRVVLAYGVRDLTPDLPRFDEFYGTRIFHCPDCDGYEARDSRIGIVGSGKSAAGMALRMLQWSDQVRIFTNGADKEMDAEQVSKLLAENIDVREERIIELLDENGALGAAVLENGEHIEVDFIFFTIGVERTCRLAEDLGCEVYDDKPNVKVDELRKTTVDGVYAVGDLVPGSQLAITSAADGAIAAIAINKSLLPPSRRV